MFTCFDVKRCERPTAVQTSVESNFTAHQRCAFSVYLTAAAKRGPSPFNLASAFGPAESNEPVSKLDSLTDSRQIRFSERLVRETICNVFFFKYPAN